MTATLERPRTFIGAVKDLILDRGGARSRRKAAVGAATGNDPTWAAPLAALEGGREFWGLIERRAVLLQAGFVRTAFRTKTAVQVERARGYKLGPGELKPISRMGFVAPALEPHAVGAITVFTDEMVQSTERGTDAAIIRQLSSGVITAANAAMINPAVAGSITAGITPLSSSGLTDEALFSDLVQLLGVGDQVVLIASLRWSVRIAAALGSAAPLVRLIVCPEAEDLIVAVDPTAVVVAWDEDVDVVASQVTSLQMTDSPQSGPQDLTSMYQTNSTAVRAEIRANWQRVRDEGVVVLEMAGS